MTAMATGREADALTEHLGGPGDRNRSTRDSDRGSATIAAAMLAGLLTAVAAAVLALGSAVLARHRAGAAADLAALTAAVHVEAGDAACDWARRVVAVHHARLVRCGCDSTVCVVRAAVGTPWGAAAVTSRAGPANTGSTTITGAADAAMPTAPVTIAGTHSIEFPHIADVIPVAETQPVARAPPAPGRQLRAAFAGTLQADAQQPYRHQEQPPEYRAGDEDLRRGGVDPDAEESQPVLGTAGSDDGGGYHHHQADQAQRYGDHHRRLSVGSVRLWTDVQGHRLAGESLRSAAVVVGPASAPESRGSALLPILSSAAPTRESPSCQRPTGSMSLSSSRIHMLSPVRERRSHSTTTAPAAPSSMSPIGVLLRRAAVVTAVIGRTETTRPSGVGRGAP
ncbi:MAG: hypothetical protein JF587_22235 [Catenulisporales bacterium]|nr:hypothetical protein [Catenulisporales bacterium]